MNPFFHSFQDFSSKRNYHGYIPSAIHQHVPHKFNVPIFVVGNKTDLLQTGLPENCGILELADMIFPDFNSKSETNQLNSIDFKKKVEDHINNFPANLQHDCKDKAHMKLCLEKSREKFSFMASQLSGLQETVISAKEGGEQLLELWADLVQINISPKPVFIKTNHAYCVGESRVQIL